MGVREDFVDQWGTHCSQTSSPKPPMPASRYRSGMILLSENNTWTPKYSCVLSDPAAENAPGVPD
jgi:hypothetical protein